MPARPKTVDGGNDERRKALAQGREPDNAGPLAGIRVLDMTDVVLGPLATQILGDYGAEVIKVESPAGDLMRGGSYMQRPGMASVFLNLNRNKRSLCVDLRQARRAVAALRRIVPSCDVLVHNMRVEAIERLGFGYEAVNALRPEHRLLRRHRLRPGRTGRRQARLR